MFSTLRAPRAEGKPECAAYNPAAPPLRVVLKPTQDKTVLLSGVKFATDAQSTNPFKKMSRLSSWN